jgi:glutamine amidotransferase
MGNVMQTNCHPFTYKNLTFMHNGTVPHYKNIKRKLMQTLSENAFNLIQGTTDSEMMFAVFVTVFERLTGERDGAMDQPFSCKDHTEHLAAAMRETLSTVHKFALEHEDNIKQAIPDKRVEPDGADGADFECTTAIGRLNLAVTDGASTITSRYVTSDPSTAHTLYYTRGAGIEYKGSKCCVAKCPNSQPMVVVSSEPLGDAFACEAVPVNHMVVTGPNNYFSIEPCK